MTALIDPRGLSWRSLLLPPRLRGETGARSAPEGGTKRRVTPFCAPLCLASLDISPRKRGEQQVAFFEPGA